MKKNYSQGFTLIELLVVIAIIGILASVVLASLNTARSKGADAAIKANLANARAQAELYYDSQSPNSYTGVCTAATGIGSMVGQAATTAGTTGGVVTTGTAQSSTTSNCYTSGTAWAASVPLKSTAGSYYCVDSTGASKTTATALAANTAVCS